MMQSSLFDRLPDKTGRQLRDEALDTIERRRKDWLERARKYALRIALANGSVSADDIDLPLPTGAHPSTRGAIFRSPWFEPWQLTHAQRPERHAGRIMMYRLTDEGWAAGQELGGPR